MSTNATIKLWGTNIGAISWLPERQIGVFQYDPAFLRSNIQVSPIMMPLGSMIYEFPTLSKDTFKGLPGLLADSLPDKYGNAMIDAWLAAKGRSRGGFNPVERLCYIGKRGMGALEFEPETEKGASNHQKLEVDYLVELASTVLQQRTELEGTFGGQNDREVIADILRVGTSAGGARAKAIIAWNPETQEFRSGQVQQNTGFEYWLIKFDGVEENGEHGVADPKGFGKIEYVYHLMAKHAGIEMMECRLHHEGGRSHFMTKRFDRTEKGKKIHMQSLGALAHFDYQQPGSYSYEQCFQVMRKLGLSQPEMEQQFVRAVFNVIARNQDDHVKNIAFLMDRRGVWSLAPAFDVIYAWNPSGLWTSRHQMSINGKRDNFDRSDLIEFGIYAGLKKPKINRIIDRVKEAISNWEMLAKAYEVPEDLAKKVTKAHRLNL